MAEPDPNPSDWPVEIEPKVEPWDEEELGMKELISRLLILEQQVSACLESQPLIHRVFRKCNSLEQRLRKLNVRLNKLTGGTSAKRQKANAGSEDSDDMHGTDPDPDWNPDGGGCEPETEHDDEDTDSRAQQTNTGKKPNMLFGSRTRPKKILSGETGTRATSSRTQSSSNSVNPSKIFRCKVCPPCPDQSSFEDAESLATHYVETHPITGLNTNTADEVQVHSRKRRGRKRKSPLTSEAKMRRRKPDGDGDGCKQPLLCSKGCGQSFPRGAGSKNHLMYCLGPGPYKCPQCPTVLLNRKTWRSHKRLVHSEKGNVLCPTCGQSITIGGLKYHMQIHAGEDRRKYICKTCGARFAGWTDLQIHNRTHTGERPFACPQCDRRFKARATLRIHMVLHTGCVCEHCEAKFGSMWHLRNHRRQEHADAEAEAAAGTSIKRKTRLSRTVGITGAEESAEFNSNTPPAPRPPDPDRTSTPDPCETPSADAGHQEEEPQSA